MTYLESQIKSHFNGVDQKEISLEKLKELTEDGKHTILGMAARDPTGVSLLNLTVKGIRRESLLHEKEAPTGKSLLGIILSHLQNENHAEEWLRVAQDEEKAGRYKLPTDLSKSALTHLTDMLENIALMLRIADEDGRDRNKERLKRLKEGTNWANKLKAKIEEKEAGLLEV